ncbi:MAG: alpha-L-fucosidase [Armatimonadota bacterium]|nr:alpha-L-fucosidase [Armatimonadota bacterium]
MAITNEHRLGLGLGWAFTALLVALLALALCVPLWAATAVEDQSYSRATPEQMKWWSEARFGLFVHWGPISLKGTEIGWSRGKYGGRGLEQGGGIIPVEEYDNLYKQFNPVKFDPDEWVRIAKAAGMKYLVFTTKHHDGFCEFDSKLTDYKITNSPYGKDIVAQLAKACYKAKLPLGFYYSPLDWHHPDYFTANHARYIEYMHGQLRELCTNYGKISIIWFDGLFSTAEDMDSPRMIKMIRELQPGILINNRAGLPADFGTPEQEIGGFDNTRPWESCITIGNRWSWKPNDNIQSLKECIDTLALCAGGDGNLLLNVGPMPDGRIEDRQVERLKEIGAWLKKNGESIYATHGGPFMPTKNIASTYKSKTVFLHILKWPEGADEIKLPGIGKKIVSARLLTGGKVNVEQRADCIQVMIKPEDRNALDTIVALKLDGPASDIEPVRLTTD